MKRTRDTSNDTESKKKKHHHQHDNLRLPSDTMIGVPLKVPVIYPESGWCFT